MVFLHSSLESSMLFRRSYFIITDTTINKSPLQCLNIGLNWGTNYKTGLKQRIN